MFFYMTLILIALLALTFGCRDVIISTPRIEEGSQMRFRLAEMDFAYSATGRPIYIHQSQQKTLYLYHTTVGPSQTGVARWIVNDIVNDKDTALAWIDSWAVAPHLISSIQDNTESQWHTFMTFPDEIDENRKNRWEADPAFSVFCEGEDTTVFFDSPAKHGLAGYYVEHRVPHKLPPGIQYNGPLFVRICPREIPKGEPGHLYLYKGQDKWIIGVEWGVEHGIAFVSDSAKSPYDMRHDEWSFAKSDEDGGGWSPEFARLYSSRTEVAWSTDNVFAYADISLFVRAFRSLKSVPVGQLFQTLRNSIPIPLLGLGTGGLRVGDGVGGAYDTIANALHLGYRTLDLAREYKNEHLIPAILNNRPEPPKLDGLKIPLPDLLGIPIRSDLFIITKVWPTHLGFWPTTESIEASLANLETTYIDSYLLHWPSCNPNVDWMHCQDSIDPEGTWIQSWKALERAYAEGRVQSIGVSNFDIKLLNELLEISSIKPHIVQNYAAIGTEQDASGVALDLEVREWCKQNNVLYIPYAQTRNLKEKGMVNKLAFFKPSRPGKDLLHYYLDAAAMNHKKSRLACVLRFFVQTGAAIIPRASNLEHLIENMRVTEFELTAAEMESFGWIQNAEIEMDL